MVEELLAEFRAGETSFELRSRGGYARSVTGTIAYLDEERIHPWCTGKMAC